MLSGSQEIIHLNLQFRQEEEEMSVYSRSRVENLKSPGNLFNGFISVVTLVGIRVFLVKESLVLWQRCNVCLGK